MVRRAVLPVQSVVVLLLNPASADSNKVEKTLISGPLDDHIRPSARSPRVSRGAQGQNTSPGAVRIDCDLGFVSQPEIRPETRPPVREMLVFEVCAPRAALKDQYAARCGRDTSFGPPKPPCTERGCVDQSYVHLLPSFGSGEGKNAKKRQNMSVNDIARCFSKRLHTADQGTAFLKLSPS